MEQIAAGAEEAAGASQEQSVALKSVVGSLNTARLEAERANRQTELLANALSETSAQILRSVRAIERGAERQSQVVALVGILDQRAKAIGEISRVVSRISDQTNLLALNAAIEAARAGAEGRGFAVVADEVRTLAGTSDKSARQVQSLTEAILSDIAEVGTSLKKVAETTKKDALVGASVAQALESRLEDMTQIAEGSQNIRLAAAEAERAALEAQKGAEQISSAAQEQASGASEAQSATDQQSQSLSQGQQAAQDLAQIAERVRAGRATASTIEQISASAEQLSAAIQEMSSAASQVMAAVTQISRAAQVQSSATHETSAAAAQIESSARQAQKSAQVADERVKRLDAALKDGRKSVDEMVLSVAGSLADSQSSSAAAKRLEGVGRKIEKIVDAIALTTVQTGMLAVSGSVEAARAGDAGRGFAVVSNDIRNLSREASDNIERAKETVQGILDQIEVLKVALEQFIATAEIEAQNNRTISNSLLRIEKEVGGLRVASSTILNGADEILSATGEIAKAARQIATAAEEASSAAREASTAATEQSTSAEDLAAAIEEIATLADELKEISA
ncbi:MAG TPA: methyl-accepting chemotaxis protein [Steroidobacteraceae bacterium]